MSVMPRARHPALLAPREMPPPAMMLLLNGILLTRASRFDARTLLRHRMGHKGS